MNHNYTPFHEMSPSWKARHLVRAHGFNPDFFDVAFGPDDPFRRQYAMDTEAGAILYFMQQEGESGMDRWHHNDHVDSADGGGGGDIKHLHYVPPMEAIPPDVMASVQDAMARTGSGHPSELTQD